MILGAMVDLGVDIKSIENGLEQLGLKGYSLRSKKIKRGLISGTKVSVSIAKSVQHHSSYSHIKKLIQSSRLSGSIKDRSLKILKSLGKAEAEIHGTSLSKVHFHEVGAIDSIVDIVGGVIAIDLINVNRIYVSPLNTGEGRVTCKHGVLPVPAPATLKLLKGVPCFSSGVEMELTTPTGAAILSTIADGFGSMPSMKITDSGYGAGSHIVKELPNLLRVILGETGIPDSSGDMIMIEANIDDMNPELFEYVMERLFEAGAVDVFFTPIMMKKNRSAITISVLTSREYHDAATEILLIETTTFGVRFYEVSREVLERKAVMIKTRYGKASVNVGKRNGKQIQLSPEYDDCKKIAQKRNLPIKKIYEEVLSVARGKGV